MSASPDPPSRALTAAEVSLARSRAARSGRHIVQELEDYLALDPARFMSMLSKACAIPYAALSDVLSWTPDFSQLTYAVARRRETAIAVDPIGRRYLLLCDPFDADRTAWCRWHLPEIPRLLLHRQELGTWLARCEETMTALSPLEEGRAANLPSQAEAEELNLVQISSDASPIIQFVNSTLYDALKSGVSDIHFESDARGLTLKFRLDGVLSVVGHMDGLVAAEQVISRIKVMAELDISERRVPQDGRLQVSRQGRAIDVRVSIMPSIHGEDAVLRILDRRALEEASSGLTLASLGFDEHTAVLVRRLAKAPYGMLLVTGPTGSGKTTTLYAALSDTHNPADKTITIEDPVEYQLPGILQIPVNEKKGLSFARGLRSILRHDPDRILVGEIRDPETAQIAVQSALTGHVVFTTVHANGVLDVFGRFVQFGIDPYSFVSALNGVLGQRLLRRLCDQCARIQKPTEKDFAEGDVPETLKSSPAWRQSVGCAHCRGTGFRGRFAIGEILRLNDTLRSMIAERASLLAIGEAARANGLTTLRDQALRAAAAGRTTLDEVNRVTTA